MATAKKKAAPAPSKRQPGRPKSATSEKLEQFSIRLPPKMKFGLELLARAQHRSLSQSVEWALQVGLNAHFVNQDQLSVADLMEKAWSAPNDYRRALAIYDAAPSLCDFEDYNACLMVERSRERAELYDLAHSTQDNRYHDALFHQFVGLYWEPLRAVAEDLSTKGKELSNRPLLIELDLGLDRPRQIVESLRRAIESMGQQPVRTDDVLPPLEPGSF